MSPRPNAVDELRALVRGRGSGERLPSERALALQLGTGRSAVRHALARLADQGLVETRAQSGSYVSRRDTDQDGG